MSSRFFFLVALLLVASCTANPSYIGQYTESATVKPTGGPARWTVTLYTRGFVEDKLHRGHLDGILTSLGIQYTRESWTVRFDCSKAELIGFLAVISKNGKVSVSERDGWIAVKSLGFPVEAQDIIIRQSHF